MLLSCGCSCKIGYSLPDGIGGCSCMPGSCVSGVSGDKFEGVPAVGGWFVLFCFLLDLCFLLVLLPVWTGILASSFGVRLVSSGSTGGILSLGGVCIVWCRSSEDERDSS